MNPADVTDPDSGEWKDPDDLGARCLDASAPPPATALIGRDTEVSLLADRWEQAQEGMGQVVLLVGEAGLGKSRLVQTIKQHVLAEAERDAVPGSSACPIIEWRCSPHFQNTGLHPVADHLERYFEFGPTESPAVRFDRLAQHLEDHDLGRPELVACFAKLLFLPADERYPTSTLTPVREREETFRAVREWLRACSRRVPVLFVIEDLHWIDASSLELLGQFIAEGLHDRILTVLTFRPEFQTPWSAAAHQTSVALNRLTRRQVAQLMRGDGSRPVPDSLVAQVYERTRGVPLLVKEFTRMLGELALFEPTREHEIPATLQQLVMSRLGRLSSNYEVAHFAATLGREFPYELLAAVVSVDEVTLQAELNKLTSADILHTKGQPPRCNYLFRHALLEEALQSALEDEQQSSFHRRVAEVIETRFPQTAETRPELLALHFTEAGLPGRAVDYWLRAGQRSHEKSANVEAINHLTKGLELLETLTRSSERDARELEFLGPLGTAYIATRGYAASEVGPIFDRALTLAESVGQSPHAFAMMRGHFAYHIVRGDFQLCTGLAADAVRFAEELKDPGILMEALFLDGLTRLYRGDFVGAHDCCARALADYDDRARTAFWAARTGEDSGVTTRSYLALASWHLGFPERALALNSDARTLARSLDHPFSLEYALHHTGWLYQHCRLGAQTQAAGEEEMQIATEQGFLFWHASGALYSAAGLLLSGKLEDGLSRFQLGLEAYRATGACLGLPYYLSILGEAFTQSGRFEDARRVLDEALAIAGKNEERFQEAELHRLRAELHLATGNDEVAVEACFSQAIEIARRQGSRAWELRSTLGLARLRHRQGRRHEAFAALSTVLSTFTEGLQFPDLVDAAAFLKELGNERMHEDIAAGIKYVRGCIPPPMRGAVSVDWRYLPSSTLGGDAIGYHWVDAGHLAFYLIDVTGHGLDSALLSVTITNVVRSGSLAGADPRRPDQVLAALNDSFQGSQHGYKFFTMWYGVFESASRTLTYASGGHPSAVLILPGDSQSQVFPATGPVLGISPGASFSASSTQVPPDSQLFIFSDGVFEVRRDRRTVWDLSACLAHIAALSKGGVNVMDSLLYHVHELRGSSQLDDDFSIITAHLH